MSNVASPNEIEGYLLRDIDTEFDGKKDCIEIMDLAREVWECGECGRLAFSFPEKDDSMVKWYKPENGMPGHLMKFDK